MHPPVAPPLPQPDVAVVHVSAVHDWNRYYDSSVPSTYALTRLYDSHTHGYRYHGVSGL